MDKFSHRGYCWMTVPLYKAARGFHFLFLYQHVCLYKSGPVVLFGSISMSLEHSSFPVSSLFNVGKNATRGTWEGQWQTSANKKLRVSSWEESGNEARHPPHKLFHSPPSRSVSVTFSAKSVKTRSGWPYHSLKYFELRRHLEPSVDRIHFVDVVS